MFKLNNQVQTKIVSKFRWRVKIRTVGLWRTHIENSPTQRNVRAYALYHRETYRYTESRYIEHRDAKNANGKIENGLVTLKVYNILGKEVATLINERLQPGTYEVQFSGNQLSSGVYFYKLEAGDFSAVKRMVFLK